MYKSSSKEKYLRSLFVFLGAVCLALNIFSFYVTNTVFRMTSDDCYWNSTTYEKPNHIGFRILNITPGGVSDAAGLKDGDILIAINGVPFKHDKDGMEILNQYSDEYVTYTILRGNDIMELNIWVYKIVDILFNILWLMGMGFLIFGFIVGYSKPQELTSKLFYFLGLAASVGLVVYSNSKMLKFDGPYASYVLINQLSLIYFIFGVIGAVFVTPLFFHFFMTYPIKRDFKYRKMIIAGVYAVIIVAVLIEMTDNYLAGRNIFLISDFTSRILTIAILISGIIIFIDSIRKIKDPNLKKSVLIIRNGFIIGAVGFLYYLIFFVSTSKPYFLIKPVQFIPIMTVLAIPFSFGYSIIKYRILDTEYIIKKSIVFGIVSFLILAIYLIMVYILNIFAGDYIENSKQVFIIAFIIIATFTFDFVNTKSKDLVDKIFYKEKYNYRKSLLKFSEEISYITDFNELMVKTKNEILNSIGIRKIIVCITNHKYLNLLRLPADLTCSKENRKYLEAIHMKLFKTNSDPVLLYPAFYKELSLSDSDIPFIESEQIKLSIPLFLESRFLGSINFGGKISGKEFSDEDIDLLKTIAIQISVALENSRLQKIEYKNRVIDEELKIAKNIQTGLLPDFDIQKDLYQIRGLSIPSKVIGGDFYDIIRLDNDKYLTLVADVSGKGIPAALYMAKMQSMIQFASELLLSPRELLIEINRQIYEQIDRKFFITALIAMFDFKNNIVTSARAGHLPMEIFSPSGRSRVLTKGIGIGLESGKLFENNLEEAVTKIEKDTIYFLYTDGLNETMNINSEEYGEDRLSSLILKNRHLDVKTLEDIIMQDIETFRGNAEQHDDITFEIIKTK
jgi:serine phosphatase RsbU (regulator of sigma subunit)